MKIFRLVFVLLSLASLGCNALGNLTTEFTPTQTATEMAGMPTETETVAPKIPDWWRQCADGTLVPLVYGFHGRAFEGQGFEFVATYDLCETGRGVSLEYWTKLDGLEDEWGNDSLKLLQVGGNVYELPAEVGFPTVSYLLFSEDYLTVTACADDEKGGVAGSGCSGETAEMTAGDGPMAELEIFTAVGEWVEIRVYTRHPGEIDRKLVAGITVTNVMTTTDFEAALTGGK